MEEFSDLMFRWLRNSKMSSRAHQEASKYFDRMHKQIGIQTVMFSLMAAMLYILIEFIGIPSHFFAVLKIFPALLSVLVAVFATLHTFMGYERRAKDHQICSSQFSSIERLIESFLANPKIEHEETKSIFIENIRHKFDNLAETAPVIPNIVNRRIERQFDVSSYDSYFNDNYLKNRGDYND